MAVIITGTDPFPVCPDPKRQKIAFYDLRAPNINSLRYNVATHDWSMCLQAADIHRVPTLLLTKKSRTFPGPHEKFSRTFTEPANV